MPEGRALPAGFVSDKAQILWATGQASVALPSSVPDSALEEGLASWGRQAQPSLSSGSRQRFLLTSSRYAQYFHFADFSGDWLEVKLPPILLDGSSVVIPPIRFQRKTEKFTLPLNC